MLVKLNDFFTNGLQREIDLSYLQDKSEQDSTRRALQEWLYNYYQSGKFEITEYLKQNIIKVLGREIVDDDEWLYDYINITKKMIDRQSVIYLDPPKRYFLSEAEL